MSAVPDEPDTALRDAMEGYFGIGESDCIQAVDGLLALPELVQLRKEAEIGRRVLAPTATYGHAAARPVDDGSER
jgi:hypothetical protein